VVGKVRWVRWVARNIFAGFLDHANAGGRNRPDLNAVTTDMVETLLPSALQ
jgi:hypothetical protein